MSDPFPLQPIYDELVLEREQASQTAEPPTDDPSEEPSA